MAEALNSLALETLFIAARTRNGWQDRPVTDAQIHQLYDLLRRGPTSAFFAESGWKSNLLVNIGYGDASKMYARLPRLSFAEACTLE